MNIELSNREIEIMKRAISTTTWRLTDDLDIGVIDSDFIMDVEKEIAEYDKLLNKLEAMTKEA